MNQLLETEARELLRANQIERDISETRSCAEIAQSLGLTALAQDEANQQETTAANLQAQNMTLQVKPCKAPYFAL